MLGSVDEKSRLLQNFLRAPLTGNGPAVSGIPFPKKSYAPLLILYAF